MPRKALRIAQPRNGRPAARGAMSLTPPAAERKRGGSSNLKDLFDLGGRYDRNELTADEINKLREMIDSDGKTAAAEQIGVCTESLLTATSGFGHRLMRKTATKIRDFLR